VDVTISGASNSLALAGYQFLITPNSPTTSQLAFLNPQSDSALTNPDYVFAGNSSDQKLGVAMGNVTSTNYTDDTFTGGDQTADGSNVLVSASKLLLTLDLTTKTAVPPMIGDSFTLTLVNDSRFTFFHDSSGTSIPFTSTPGTITIISGSVPEPSSLAIAISGVLMLAFAGRWFRARSGAVIPSR
jgi:hypothetical protein